MLSPMQKMELLKQIAANPNIPSPPSVVLGVLDKASQPDCTIGDLGKLIQVDPGLSARILRTVNSAVFGLSRPATSIQRALAVVGINSARLLVLAISFPEMQQKSRSIDARARQRYWSSSVAGAIVARELSQRIGHGEPDDDMAAGLLRDLGELILQQLYADACQKILAERPEDLVDRQCELEEVHCSLSHAEVSAFILDRWRLPGEITEAIRHHHRPDQGTYATKHARERAFLLHFATRSAQLLLYPNQPRVMQQLLELAAARYCMKETDVREFLLPLGQKIAEFAGLLHVDIGEANDYQAVLSRAGEELVNLTVSTNLDNQRAQEKAKSAESEARHWRNEAVFDSLTKVFNRRFLEHRMRSLFEKQTGTTRTFGLLFIDLDGFKPLNDTYGHAFGDLVLQKVADCLSRHVRQDDVVARFGGDEFCILCDGVSVQGLRMLSQRIWEAINKLTITQGAYEGKVGASIGVVGDCLWQHPEQLLAAADQAMYRAKAAGKNRVIFWGSLDQPESQAPVSPSEGQAPAATGTR